MLSYSAPDKFVVLDVVKMIESDDPSVLDYSDTICELEEIDRVSRQNCCLALADALDYLLEDFPTRLGVKVRNRVIQEVNVVGTVDSSSATDASFLATGEIDAVFTQFSQVSCLQNLEILRQLHASDHSVILFLVERSPKCDAVPNFFVFIPGFLLTVGNRAHWFDGWLLRPNSRNLIRTL